MTTTHTVMTVTTRPARAIEQQRRQIAERQAAEASYEAALELVEWLDERLERGTLHCWNFKLELLTTLDQVMRALMDGELIVQRPHQT